MLSLGTWVLLTGTTIATAAYVVVSNFYRKRREGEPLIVKGNPILGSCVEFQGHAVNFLHRCRRDYGDVFTLRLINQYLTIIMDPHSYEAMTKEKNFDFDPIQKQVNWNVFSFVLKEPRKMIKDTGRTVRGPHLSRAMDSFVSNLDIACDQLLEKPMSVQSPEDGLTENEWKSIGVRQFASETMFDALFNQIFGRAQASEGFNSQLMYKNFETFHHYFNFFWLGFPKSWFPSAMRSLESMIACQPHSDDLLSRPDCSDYIKKAVEFMKNKDQGEGDIIGHNLVYLHVNYNTFRLAFWVLANILQDSKVEAAIRQEIDDTILACQDGDEDYCEISQKTLENMKVLDSIIQESIRLSSGVFVVRYINSDTQFKTSSGKEYLIREGDRVAIYPPAIHKDPEIFEEPETFKYDRFVDATFYKDGRQVKHPVIGFGALCPGKRFALLQLRWYVVKLLSDFDMKLVADQRPAEYDTQYYGHEILPPKTDIDMHYRSRTKRPNLSFSLH